MLSGLLAAMMGRTRLPEVNGAGNDINNTNNNNDQEREGLLSSISNYPLQRSLSTGALNSTTRTSGYGSTTAAGTTTTNNGGRIRIVISGDGDYSLEGPTGEGETLVVDVESGTNNIGNTSEAEDNNVHPQPPPQEGAIGNLTRRLRCLFSTITFPIVPLGTIVSLALLWVFYAASSLDLRKECSKPLHSYALMSLLMVSYIPNHAQVRAQIFSYSRERDGPVRPARVRMYDQFFHTVCLLYVYTGVTLVQTCKDDLVLQEEQASNQSQLSSINGHSFDLTLHDKEHGGTPISSCEATCPNLYQALSVYVTTLELFTFALVLPLLFLPCIYLWFLQRATAEADAFARLQDRLQEEDALLSNGGVTTGEIINSLEIVKVVKRASTGGSSNTPKSIESNKNRNNSKSKESDDEAMNQEEVEQQELWVLPLNATSSNTIGTRCLAKECCICMNEFHVQDASQEGNDSSSEESDERTATTATSPPTKELEDVIVRTKCGHLFHKECLKGWVGGMWSAAQTNNDNYFDPHSQDWEKRKARQVHCPLCREDLRPSSNDNATNSGNRSSYSDYGSGANASSTN